MSFPLNLKYTAEHEWIRLEGDTAVIGISDFAQGELGDVVYVDIPTVGKAVEAGAVFGSVEAVKTTSDLFMPVSGTVTEVNPALLNAPELVNSDAYNEGWMVKIKPNNPADVDALLSAEAYKQLVGA